MPKLSGINHQRAVRAFQKVGFWIAREGKHITIPRANPVDAFTMAGIVKDAGITIEDFKKLI